jgi:DNA-binding IclR family transcriptional regulator
MPDFAVGLLEPHDLVSIASPRRVQRPRPRTSMLARGLDLLACFRPDEEVVSLSALAIRAGLPMTSARRIAHGLGRWGLLERDAVGLRLGRRLLTLARPAPVHPMLWPEALPYLERLHTVTQAQVGLVIRRGIQVLRLGRLDRREDGTVLRHEVVASGMGEAGLATRAAVVAGDRGHWAPAAITSIARTFSGPGADGDTWTTHSGCVVRTDGRVAAAALRHPRSSSATVITLRGPRPAEVTAALPLLRATSDMVGDQLGTWLDPTRHDKVEPRMGVPDELPDQPVSMLDRGIHLLTCFDFDHPVLTVSELRAMSELPNSMTHRLIDAMRKRRILDSDPSGITIGAGLRSLSTRVPWHRRLVRASRPWQEEISGITGGETYLALVDRSRVIWMKCVSPRGRHRDTPAPSDVGDMWQAAADAAVRANAGAVTAGGERAVDLAQDARRVAAIAIPVGGPPHASLVCTLRRPPVGRESEVAALLQSAAEGIAAALRAI